MRSDRALLVAAGGGIGDTLLATVVARALRGTYARVDALVLPAHADVVARVAEIDRVFLVEDSALQIGRRMGRERFGAAVVTWATLFTAQIPFVARIPLRVGQARRLYSRLFTHRVVVRSERGDHRSHWTQILLDYARAIGCDTADARPSIRPTADDERDAAALLRGHEITGRFALLHPTRGLSAQRARWPIAGFTELAGALTQRERLPLLVTGARDDAPIAQAIAAAAGRGARSIAGATSLGMYAALAQRASFVVAMDSGPMHIAAAAGAPTVGIFALQSDEPDRWAPLGARTAVVRATYPCPPDHRKETCPDFACVRALDVAGILRAVDAVRIATSETT
ncbi:MAG: glycosyltransferase family 9 protein [Candidatus Velthaea sp.]|jgi:ADP-heptose:LPS heptosyltransferase